ncbi:MAG: DUF5666 domain-containing protein [Armatimonadota bacterium]
MKRFFATYLALSVLAGALGIACGGGGGNGAATSGVGLFLTDSFREDYDNVWLTLHKVEYRNQTSGQYTTAWESATGITVDAKRLRDGSGERYAFLALTALANGTYDQVRLTLGGQTILVPAGSQSGTAYPFASSLPRDGQNRPMATFSLSPALSVPASTFVLDVDLANWTLTGGEVSPVFRRGSGNGIDDSGRHEALEYEGIVSNLTSTRFTLRPSTGASFTVAYTADTPVYRSSNGAPTLLTNGASVEVRGNFLPGNNFLSATVIKVEDGNGSGEAEARGTHTDVNLGANTLVLTNLTEVEGFMPQGATVNVVWSDSTIFRRSGVQVTEDALLQWQFSEAKGTYNPATNTITATRITLEDDAGGGGGGGGTGEAEATGGITNLDLNQNRMTLTNIFDIEGFQPQGTTVNVTWTEETIFLRSGDPVTEQALLQWPRAEAKGVYDPGTNTIRASRIKLED